MIYAYNILGKYCIYTKYGSSALLYLCFMIRLLYIRDVAGPGIYIYNMYSFIEDIHTTEDRGNT